MYRQGPLWRVPIYHNITYCTVITVAESESDFRITTDTPYLTSRASYGVSFVRILEKTDGVLTAPHCKYIRSLSSSFTLRLVIKTFSEQMLIYHRNEAPDTSCNGNSTSKLHNFLFSFQKTPLIKSHWQTCHDVNIMIWKQRHQYFISTLKLWHGTQNGLVTWN